MVIVVLSSSKATNANALPICDALGFDRNDERVNFFLVNAF